MPYISQGRRHELADLDNDERTQTPGELNYMLTLFCKDYLDRHGLSYQTINDIVGALEGAKLEFYARVARPYEDEKIKQNGDVY